MPIKKLVRISKFETFLYNNVIMQHMKHFSTAKIMRALLLIRDKTLLLLLLLLLQPLEL